MVPVYRYHDLNYVKVCVADRELDFILDSGAALSAIDYSLAKRIGLRFEDQKFGVVGNGAGTAGGYVVQKGTMRIAGTGVTDAINFAVDIHPITKYTWHVLDGVLGYDFFRQHVVAIDYDRHEIRLYNPKTFRVPARGTVIPVLLDGRVPFIDLDIRLLDGDTLRGKFLVDAGSSLGVTLSGDFIEAHSVRSRVGNVIKGSGVVGVGGVSQRVNGRLAGLSVMGVELPNADVSLFNDSTTNKQAKERAGSIGARVLSKFIVYFDYQNKRMILEPPT